jgi:hypothetical protein
MITDQIPPAIDRSVHINKFKTDLEVATMHADQAGIPLGTVICELLKLAVHWRGVADERGTDLAELDAIGEQA